MSKVPIWAVAAPAQRKPRFTREQIADTALQIADTQGFELLSMRNVAERLGAATMTLYYYVRTREDLLALVEDALTGETVAACNPLPRGWRPALTKLSLATRDTYVRHPWALRSFTGARMGPNALRHIEQSLQALVGTSLSWEKKLAMLSIVDDYVVGHCASLLRGGNRTQPDRKEKKALGELLTSALDAGDYPQLRAMLGEKDPAAAFAERVGYMAEDQHFEAGLDALLDGLAKRYKLK